MPRSSTWAALGLLAAADGRATMAAEPAPSPARPHVSAGMPADFAELSRDQRVVVDVFAGDRRIGQFEADIAPGSVRFLAPDRVAAAIPDLIDRTAVTTALSGPLDTNARFRCAGGGAPCEHPQPAVAAITYDAAHFRVDLFVAPRLLAVHDAGGDRFLDPAKTVSMVDTLGLALAGGDGQHLSYAVRNRLIAGTGPARLVSEASVSSGRGLDVDTLAVQLDRPDLRWGAGLFYAPGADLVGRRRLVGVGLASQFDTRVDRLALVGTPLVVFLTQRARVDLYVQGRLVSSHTFDSGNQSLDTTGLPDGSYPVEIRIQETSGATRSEQRFFTKNAALAPIGHVVFYADAGVLAADRADRAFALSRTPLVTAGAAGRFGARIAWDGAVMATDRQAVGEAGVSLLTSWAQARVALLASTAGDGGAIAQIGSTAGGRFSYNVDLRHLYSHDGQPLIPSDDAVTTVLGGGAVPIAVASPAYTQALVNLSYALRTAQLGVSGYYRRDRGRPAAYAVGPTVRWPILQRDRLRLTANGSYAETDRGRSVAFGLQLQLVRPHASFSTTTGAQTGGGRDGRALGDVVEIAAAAQRSDERGNELGVAGSVQQGDTGIVLQAAADGRGPLGYASASLVERAGGTGATGGGTQYGLTAQTSIGIGGRGALRIGTHDQNDSIITVGVRSTATHARFEVLIDDTVRGEIAGDGHVSVAVTPYRRYRVRVRAVGDELLALDTKVRSVDLAPGSVAVLDWTAHPVLAMFGRLLRGDGTPLANADIATDGAIAATDDRGYFQIQAAGDALLAVHGPNGLSCTARLAARRSPQGYTPLGDVRCSS